MKIQMMTVREHVYAGRRLKPGDAFDATGKSDARLLEAIGRAVYSRSLPPAEPVKAEPVVEAPASESAQSEEVPGEYVRPKRQYRRRNLTAES